MRTSRFIPGFLTVCGLLLGSQQVQGVVVIDQDTGAWLNAIYNTAASNVHWQQEVTAGVTGTLDGFDFYPNGTGSADFYINLGSPWQTDAHQFAAHVTTGVDHQWVHVDTSSAGIGLTAGSTFVIGIDGTDEGLWLIGANTDSYAGGALWSQSFSNPPEPHLNGSRDINFRTYMDVGPQDVPEPSTLILLLLGTAGLFACARRRRR